MLSFSLLINISLVVFVTTICCITGCFLARKLNLVDSPDGIRKKHLGEIPLAGGLSLFVSIIIFSFLFFPLTESIPTEFKILFLVSSVVLLLGILDDIKSLPISIRLIAQIMASWIVIILTDCYIRDLGDLFGLGNIHLGQLGIPVTIFMIVGMCNAFNMLDGMDGIVSLVALTAFTSLSILVFFNQSLFLITFFISISLCVFLFFNLGLIGKKYKMFLGDGGSMWIGFILSWSLVIFSQGETPSISPAAAIWFVFLPLIDALSTFLSRLKAGKAIFSGDRTHIHHLLLDRHLAEWKILIIFFLVSLLSCLFATFATLRSVEDYLLFYGFVTLWIFYFLLIKYPSSKRKL